MILENYNDQMLKHLDTFHHIELFDPLVQNDLDRVDIEEAWAYGRGLFIGHAGFDLMKAVPIPETEMGDASANHDMLVPLERSRHFWRGILESQGALGVRTIRKGKLEPWVR